jgi:hypothetical protein
MTDNERERERRQTEKEGATERHVRKRMKMTITIILKKVLKMREKFNSDSAPLLHLDILKYYSVAYTINTLQL